MESTSNSFVNVDGKFISFQLTFNDTGFEPYTKMTEPYGMNLVFSKMMPSEVEQSSALCNAIAEDRTISQLCSGIVLRFEEVFSEQSVLYARYRPIVFTKSQEEALERMEALAQGIRHVLKGKNPTVELEGACEGRTAVYNTQNVRMFVLDERPVPHFDLPIGTIHEISLDALKAKIEEGFSPHDLRMTPSKIQAADYGNTRFHFPEYPA